MTAATLPTRIKIVIDEYFVNDFDESIRAEVAADIDTGRSEPYIITVQKRTPGGVWIDTSVSMCNSVHDSGLSGTYDTPDAIPDESLRESAREMISGVDPSELTPPRTVEVTVSYTVSVDVDAWANSFGIDATPEAVTDNARTYFATDQALGEFGAVSTGDAWVTGATAR